MRIRIIAPTADYRTETLQAITQDLVMLQRPGVELEHIQLESGPFSIRTPEDEALATPGMIAKIIQAEHEGVDAVIVDCTSDVGVREAQALVKIPIVGAGDASLLVAKRYSSYLRLNADELDGKPLEIVIQEQPRAVLIGGTGWSHIALKLGQQLAEQGLEIPIIDPLPAALDEAIRQVLAYKL
jgi:Asp/Glu/hydantoin racemase